MKGEQQGTLRWSFQQYEDLQEDWDIQDVPLDLWKGAQSNLQDQVKSRYVVP